jgi:hypothetical protein
LAGCRYDKDDKLVLKQGILRHARSGSGYSYLVLLPPQRETTYKIRGVELVNVTLEMEPLAQPTQLFGYILGIACFRPIQDQDASLAARHGDKGASQTNCRRPIGA